MTKPVVLIVDDDKDNRETFAAAVDQLGYHTLEASDGIEATLMIERHRPCLILLDIHMPNMNGWELLYCLRSDSDQLIKNIPVVIISALNKKELEIKAQKYKATGYLMKPFSFNDFERTLNQYCPLLNFH